MAGDSVPGHSRTLIEGFIGKWVENEVYG